MEAHLIPFELLDWTTPVDGLKFKKFTKGRNIVRLVEFSYGFIEKDYCTNSHAGVVLEGSFSIEYNGKLESYSAGDVICIPSGEENKHKAILLKEEKVKLLLFESEKPCDDGIEYYI